MWLGQWCHNEQIQAVGVLIFLHLPFVEKITSVSKVSRYKLSLCFSGFYEAVNMGHEHLLLLYFGLKLVMCKNTYDYRIQL